MASGMHPLFGHVFRGRYASQINQYRQLFDDVLVLDFHRIREGVGVANQLTNFIGIAPVEAEAMASANKSHVYRSGLIHRIIETEFVKDVARALVPSRFRNGVRETTTISTRPATLRLRKSLSCCGMRLLTRSRPVLQTKRLRRIAGRWLWINKSFRISLLLDDRAKLVLPPRENPPGRALISAPMTGCSFINRSLSARLRLASPGCLQQRCQLHA